jgi:predicted nucleic acid-binding Zn ribbon protein
MKKTGPTTMSEGISSVLKDLGLGQRLREVSVLDAWEDVVGEQIARIAVAERISAGKLVVRVSAATWRNELVYLKTHLIRKLNTAMNGEIVRDIIFR